MAVMVIIDQWFFFTFLPPKDFHGRQWFFFTKKYFLKTDWLIHNPDQLKLVFFSVTVWDENWKTNFETKRKTKQKHDTGKTIIRICQQQSDQLV